MYGDFLISTFKRAKLKAFTLIEILVVIIIIGILTAILFPVFAQAKQQSKIVVCMSNSRQIGIAMQMYSQDFDDRLPFLGYNTWQFTSKYDSFYCAHLGSCQPRWADLIMPYCKSAKIFTCPVDLSALANKAAKVVQISYGLNIYAYSYNGKHLNASSYGPGPTLSEIPVPAERIQITEASNQADSVALWCFRSPKLNHDLDQDNCTLKQGKIPSVYFDGHAKIFRMRGLLDQMPYTAKNASCSQSWSCVQKYYPEWAPWAP